MLEEMSSSEEESDSGDESDDDSSEEEEEAEGEGAPANEDGALDRLRDIAARPKITRRRLAGQPGLAGGVGIVEVDEERKMEE